MNKNIEKILIVVDMINGFVKEGAMADPYIKHIVPDLLDEINNYKDNGGVIFIKDTHRKDAIEFMSYPEHCLKGTSESELIDELKQYEDNALGVYEKNSTSAIFIPNFIEDLEKLNNLKEIIIAGCCTDICILNLAIPLKNYFNQKNKNINIVVPEKLVETFNSEDHNRNEYNTIAFKLLKQSGIKVI